MILKARYVLPMNAPFIENGAVLVGNETIRAIGPADKILAENPFEEVIDYDLAALMPGFVDAHTHLEYSMMSGVTGDLPYAPWKVRLDEKAEMFSPEDWENSALLGALESLSCGVTTIADCTNTGASLRAANEVGLRGVIFREFGTRQKKEAERVLNEAAAEINEWRDFVAHNNLITIGISPSAVYQSHPYVLELTSEYASDGTPVAIHLAASKEECDFIRYGSSPFYPHINDDYEPDYERPWLPAGTSPVRYILNWKILDVPNVLAVHCTQLDEQDIRFLAQRDVAVAWCPRCNARLGMGAAPIRALRDAGVRIGVGTDSPAANTSMDAFSELRSGLLIQRSVNPGGMLSVDDMLRFGTIDGARALRMENEIGSLEVGKQADIIAVDLSEKIPSNDPRETLVYTCFSENVRMTMIAGKILYQDGDFPFFRGAERLLSRREEMRKKLYD